MKPFYHHADITVRGVDVTVEVYYSHTTGGGHPDEPRWTEIDFGQGDLYHPARARPLSNRLQQYILGNHATELSELIGDNHDNN